MLATALICLTVLAIAGIAAWLIHELAKDASSTRILLADKERGEAVATGELAAAVRALQLVADRLAPAPARVGLATTIHTRDGQTITGVLLDELEDRTRLDDARYVSAGGEQPVPGATATILKANESWRQEHGR